MREINKIILHCSATPEGRDVSTATIRGWHIKGNGWKDIAYHWVIRLDGTIDQGRPEAKVGSHCKGHNHDSIGICYVGGVDKAGNPKDTRTAQQKAALKALVKSLLYTYGEHVTVHGHNEFSSKACPSFDVEKEFA